MMMILIKLGNNSFLVGVYYFKMLAILLFTLFFCLGKFRILLSRFYYTVVLSYITLFSLYFKRKRYFKERKFKIYYNLISSLHYSMVKNNTMQIIN